MMFVFLRGWQDRAGLQIQVADNFSSNTPNIVNLGFVAIEQRLVSTQDFDVLSDKLKEKYVPVRQPIPKRPPDGLNMPRLIWTICKRLLKDAFLN